MAELLAILFNEIPARSICAVRIIWLLIITVHLNLIDATP